MSDHWKNRAREAVQAYLDNSNLGEFLTRESLAKNVAEIAMSHAPALDTIVEGNQQLREENKTLKDLLSECLEWVIAETAGHGSIEWGKMRDGMLEAGVLDRSDDGFNGVCFSSSYIEKVYDF